MSWPTPGFSYSTRQVGNTATRPCSVRPSRPPPARRRLLNHVVNRTRANGGSTRAEAMPTVFSITFRPNDPGLVMTALARGAVSDPKAPTRSVRDRAWVASFERREPSLRLRTAFALSMSRGKSSCHSWGGM